MINDSSVSEAVEYLNTFLKRDPIGVARLFDEKVATTKSMAIHPRISLDLETDGYELSVLNIINALYGTISTGSNAGKGPIEIERDEEGSIVKFERVR